MGEKELEKKGGDGGATAVTVVLKVDLHCEGCTQKIKKTLKHLNGVESVKADFAANKLTVVGQVDPTKVKEKVEEKTKKKVELVSPQPAKKEKNGSGGGGGGGGGKKSDEKSEKKPDDSKKAEEKKPKEPAVTTVVLKTTVHCDGCAHKMRKIIKRYEGVQEVNVDLSKDQITVKGTMDMKEMLPYLNTKLKRVVEIAPPPAKKDGGKKPKDGGSEDKGKEDAKPGGENDGKIEVMNKMEYYGYPYGYGFHTYNPQQPPAPENGYVAEYWHAPAHLHAPQMFSDENPNACSIM